MTEVEIPNRVRDALKRLQSIHDPEDILTILEWIIGIHDADSLAWAWLGYQARHLAGKGK